MQADCAGSSCWSRPGRNVASPHVTDRRRRLLDAEHEGGGARPRIGARRRQIFGASSTDHATRQRTGPRRLVVGVRARLGRGRRSGGRRDQRRRPAARHGRPRRRPAGDQARQAVERHRERGRRRLVVRPTRGRGGGVGVRGRQRAGCLVHDHEVVVAAPQGAGGVGPPRPRRAPARLADVSAHRRTGDRPGGCLGHRILVAGDR